MKKLLIILSVCVGINLQAQECKKVVPIYAAIETNAYIQNTSDVYDSIVVHQAVLKDTIIKVPILNTHKVPYKNTQGDWCLLKKDTEYFYYNYRKVIKHARVEYIKVVPNSITINKKDVTSDAYLKITDCGN